MKERLCMSMTSCDRSSADEGWLEIPAADTIQLWGEGVRCESRLRGRPAGVLRLAAMPPSCLGLCGSHHLPDFIPLLGKMAT